MDIKWMLRRMRAMNASELCWRVQMKALTKREKKLFYDKHLPVTQFAPDKPRKPDGARLSLNWENEGTRYTGMRMFDCYEERDYRTRWNAGFQTENDWPETPYSPTMRIGQREDIGDIRTNWELNRHFQLAQLAKSYYVGGDEADLAEFAALFEDWNAHNLFLHGPQWTSAMELAIRVNSWIYAWCFLDRAFEKWGKRDERGLLEALSNGIQVMTAYIVRHRAHGSSANNHLIVELYAVAMAGLFYDDAAWKKLAFCGLTRELDRQNSEDGVNLEMATHYQAFVMEAYGLLMLQPGTAHMTEGWKPRLTQMSRFLCDCCGAHGETAIFGDDDSGKILDLGGRNVNDIHVVLQLMGCALDERYIDEPPCETIRWLAAEEAQKKNVEKTRYCSPLVSVRREGGYTILRSGDQAVLIALDHGPLGFGALAAHGHADALSIQAFRNGKKILTDPGTWNYHLCANLRDLFRAETWHSTVYVTGQPQSEMLGPFLWGRRAQTRLLDVQEDEGGVTVRAQTEYGTIRHTRTLRFDKMRTLTVEDEVEGAQAADARKNFSLAPDLRIRIERNRCTAENADGAVTLMADGGDWQEAEYAYSGAYNHREKAARVTCRAEAKTEIHF